MCVNKQKGEVMKKLVMIGMVLVFAASIFALESEPSEVVGYVTYECVLAEGTDWNFIALSMGTGLLTTADLGDAISGCNSISVWNVESQSSSQTTWMGPPFNQWTNIQDLDDGYAYMVNVTEAVDVYIAGGMIVQPTYDLALAEGTDWNWIMVPMDATFTQSSGIADDIGVCNAIGNWNATTQSTSQSTWMGPPFNQWTNVFDIAIGMPLLVNINSEVSWPDGTVLSKNPNTVSNIRK